MAVGNGVWFSASVSGTSGTGRELWRSDGTAAGTVLVGDIRPGPESASPYGLTLSAGRLLFAADDGRVGIEPWAIDDPGASAQEIGHGCPPLEPTMHATPPVLGTTMTLSGEGVPNAAAGVILVGLPASRPTPIGGGCLAYFDLAFPVSPWTVVTATRWTVPLPLANDSRLDGAQAILQTIWVRGTGPQLLPTNAVRLRLGR